MGLLLLLFELLLDLKLDTAVDEPEVADATELLDQDLADDADCTRGGEAARVRNCESLNLRNSELLLHHARQMGRQVRADLVERLEKTLVGDFRASKVAGAQTKVDDLHQQITARCHLLGRVRVGRRVFQLLAAELGLRRE